MVGSTPITLPASILNACFNYSNWWLEQLLNALSSFSGVFTPPTPPTPLSPVTAKMMAELTKLTAVKFTAVLIPCSMNRVQILSASGVSKSQPLSIVYFILKPYVWRALQFCDTILRLVLDSSLRFFNWFFYIPFFEARNMLDRLALSLVPTIVFNTLTELS